MRSTSLAARAGISAAAALTILSTHTGPAHAASWHGIEGTVYQKRVGKDWYHSPNKRPKMGTGPVKAQFSGLPEAGLTFKIRDKHNRTIGYPHSWTQQETDVTRTFASKVKNRRLMYTSFKQYNACDRCSPYSFDGSLYY